MTHDKAWHIWPLVPRSDLHSLSATSPKEHRALQMCNMGRGISSSGHLVLQQPLGSTNQEQVAIACSPLCSLYDASALTGRSVGH